jgi:hypothetical protein
MDTRAHNTLTLIKRLTENKDIQLDPNVDATIGKIIQLALIYEDKERASWR